MNYVIVGSIIYQEMFTEFLLRASTRLWDIVVSKVEETITEVVKTAGKTKVMGERELVRRMRPEVPFLDIDMIVVRCFFHIPLRNVTFAAVYLGRILRWRSKCGRCRCVTYKPSYWERSLGE